jgi:hypothetical protein
MRSLKTKRDREDLATHEAGHVVVSYRLGLRQSITGVELHDSPKANKALDELEGGRVTVRPGQPVKDWQLLVMYLAGPLAEWVRSKGQRGMDSFEGELQQLQAIGLTPSAVLMTWAEREARKHVEESWPTITAVAATLLERGRLAKRQLDTLINGRT